MIRLLGKGWLGYVGDVNGEEDTDAKVFGIVEDYLDIPYMVTFAGTALDQHPLRNNHFNRLHGEDNFGLKSFSISAIVFTSS